MRYFGYFWILFAGYFVFVHPAIIYYSTRSFQDLEGKDPVWALVYLSIVLVGWSSVFLIALRFVYKYTFGLLKGVKLTINEGEKVKSTVQQILKQKIISDEHHSIEMLVSFNNFAKQPVQHVISLQDTKPHLKRYEPGKQVDLKIDKTLRRLPYIVIDGSDVKLNNKALLIGFGGWSICLGLFITYLIFSYQTESLGYGWRYLSFMHPLILSLLILILALYISYFLIYKLILSKFKGVERKRASQLLLFGDRATAFITDTSQTGTYINEQPEIKYQMYYSDSKGVRHEITLKRIVSLLDLHSVQHKTTQQIMYLPDKPEIFALEEDIISEKMNKK